MRGRWRCFILAASAFVAALLAPVVVHATEPLFDRVEMDGYAGRLHDAQRGWLELPHSEQFRALALSERCSAIGGPRGKFKVVNGQLWLYGLYRCAGDLSVQDVYPDSPAQVVATWVTGELVAELGRWVCQSRKGSPLFEKTAHLVVEEGRVKSVRYVTGSPTQECARDAP